MALGVDGQHMMLLDKLLIEVLLRDLGQIEGGKIQQRYPILQFAKIRERLAVEDVVLDEEGDKGLALRPGLAQVALRVQLAEEGGSGQAVCQAAIEARGHQFAQAPLTAPQTTCPAETAVLASEQVPTPPVADSVIAVAEYELLTLLTYWVEVNGGKVQVVCPAAAHTSAAVLLPESAAANSLAFALFT
ncbi:hypothetical protein D3C86_1608690 [compost metagenome]